MRTIKVKILGVLVMMLLSATVSFGQSVYYDASKGGVVIDCTMMPESSVLAKSMKDSKNDNQLIAHKGGEKANTVYPLLVVATVDLSTSKLNWEDAVTAAKDESVTYNKTTFKNWRLPNQRELLLIWVLREKIKAAAEAAKVTFTEFKSGNAYWTSTLVNAGDSDSSYFIVIFGSYDSEGGGTYSVLKDNEYSARAVREIPLP